MGLTDTTNLLDYGHPAIQAIVKKHGWRELGREGAIEAAYNFVRDEIRFGYNLNDVLPASEILGECRIAFSLFIPAINEKPPDFADG